MRFVHELGDGLTLVGWKCRRSRVCLCRECSTWNWTCRLVGLGLSHLSMQGFAGGRDVLDGLESIGIRTWAQTQGLTPPGFTMPPHAGLRRFFHGGSSQAAYATWLYDAAPCGAPEVLRRREDTRGLRHLASRSQPMPGSDAFLKGLSPLV